MISRQIDEEGEDWKRLSSRSLKMSRASVVPTVSASVRLPPGLPPSPPKTQSPDERTRLRSVVTNISSKSDLKVSRASVAPTMSVRTFHQTHSLTSHTKPKQIPAVHPPISPSTPSSQTRTPDERARLRSVVSGLLSASPLRNGSIIVPPGIESRRNGEFNRTTKSEPDSRARIGRVSKLSPTRKDVKILDVDTAAPPGVVARRTYLCCCSINVSTKECSLKSHTQVRVPRAACSQTRHPIWHE